MTAEGATIIGAAIAVAGSLIVFTINSVVAARRENANRKRDVFSKAFEACIAYKEVPYVVRRRRPSAPEEERVRISEELCLIQERLSYYMAWMVTESSEVAKAYQHLVDETRRIAGRQIREAWRLPPMDRDEDMNMPDLGLGMLKSAEEAYLAAVRSELRLVPTASVVQSG